MWVGRATVFLVGLAVILALVFGATSAAFGATGDNFILGFLNKAADTTTLSGNVAGGPALQVANSNTAIGSRGLQVGVAAGKPPIQVNAKAGKAINLNADKLDGKDSAELLPSSVYLNEQFFDAAPLQEQDTSVSCDEGDTLLSGGFETVGLTIKKSFPSAENTWTVTSRNPSSSVTFANQSVTILCADTNPGNPTR